MAARTARAAKSKRKAAPMSTTVRVSRNTHRVILTLANETGKPLQEVLDTAVERYRRELFFQRDAEAWERLRGDPAAWEEELEERALWESLDADLEDH